MPINVRVRALWQAWEIELLQQLSGQLAIAIQQSALYTQLQDRQYFIQQIADASPNILYLYDVSENRNVYVNREIGSILGYTPAEIQAMGSTMFPTLLHPDDLSQFPGYYAQINAAQDGEILEFEYRMRHANGEWRWLHSRDAVFARDAQGRVTQTVGAAQDITARKRLEQEQKRLLAVLEASTDYISMSDPTGNIIWNNAALKRICGLERDAVLQHRSITDYHPQWAAELILQQGLPAAIALGSWMGETALLDAAGQEIPLSQLILAHKSPQGEVEFFSTIARDIRDRKEYEQRLERTNAELIRATRLKDEFLANMSHELRTPLNSILGMSEALQENVYGPVNERQKHAIATVEHSGQHLLALINDILEVSKIEAGKLELDIKPVSVKQLCHSSLAFVKQQALQKNIQLTTHLTLDQDTIAVDERRLRQVLINLLSNAVKFTPAGGSVTLAVRQQEDGDRREERLDASAWILFSVTDTGIGIAAADQPKLFQPFIQLDSSLSRQYEGTGLGLALVKKIVELHGGSVSLQSALGQGSCFTVHLPCRNADSWGRLAGSSPEALAPTVAVGAVGAIAMAPLILLAEDNEANILTLSSYLIAKNYRVILAYNGQEAIDLTLAHHPDLILMDIQMPGMDGLAAIQILRQRPNLSQLPIIALTALAMAGDRQRCLDAGATEYLAKPVRLHALTQMIQILLASPPRDP